MTQALSQLPGSRMEPEQAARLAGEIHAGVSTAFLGKGDAVELCIVALLAGGHLMIEDFPGVGKTLVAKSLARCIDCRFSRIQFTPDLLPSDITGVNVFNQRTGEFDFRPGPVFANVVLADEINRASPKTQSSLLECMQERQVTVENVTYPLERPFMVVATQNPIEYEGTYELPEAQLDRFMMRLALGYPSPEEELRLLATSGTEDLVERVPVVVGVHELLGMMDCAASVRMVEEVGEYLLQVVSATRSHPDLYLGASPRAGLALAAAARALALIRGREYVIPQDVKHLAVSVLAHRLILSPEARMHGRSAADIVFAILRAVPVPTL